MKPSEKYASARKQYETRRNIQRQISRGYLPMWKAVAVIEATILTTGATFEESYEALADIASEQGLRMKAITR